MKYEANTPLGAGPQIPLQIRKSLRVRLVPQTKSQEATPQTVVHQLQTTLPAHPHPHHFLPIPLHHRLIPHPRLLHPKNSLDLQTNLRGEADPVDFSDDRGFPCFGLFHQADTLRALHLPLRKHALLLRWHRLEVSVAQLADARYPSFE